MTSSLLSKTIISCPPPKPITGLAIKGNSNVLRSGNSFGFVTTLSGQGNPLALRCKYNKPLSPAVLKLERLGKMQSLSFLF